MKKSNTSQLAQAFPKDNLAREIKKNGSLFILISPGVLFTFIFSYIPLLGLYFAFTRFNFRDGLWNSPFVGLRNFDFLLNSNILLNITKNTILYNIAFIILRF